MRINLQHLLFNNSSRFSAALGQGWRLGFLGLLHMEVFNQRLEQEYGAEVIVTVPSVIHLSFFYNQIVLIKYYTSLS
jgi:translation elongation factor EF-4